MAFDEWHHSINTLNFEAINFGTSGHRGIDPRAKCARGIFGNFTRACDVFTTVPMPWWGVSGVVFVDFIQVSRFYEEQPLHWTL